MDRRRAAARLLVLGFDGLSLPAESRRLLEMGASGVVLFRRNVESAEQVASLVREIRAAAPGPVLVSVDQEGGRVARLRGIATDLPPMRAVTLEDDARAVGRLLAVELGSLGFDLDLAPVVDVDTNPKNPVIGDRAFATEAGDVARLSRAFIEGMQAAGLGASAKHFPGHGDTVTDSHLALPRLSHPLERLRDVELVPFRAAVDAGVASVMTAHVVLEAVDKSLPATMSREVLALLRGELGYDGLVMSDDLEMAAIAEQFEMQEAGRWAVHAGCDQLLVCHLAERQHHVIEGIDAALGAGKLEEKRVLEAHRHIDAVIARFDPARTRKEPGEVLRTDPHLALAERLERAYGPAGADPTGDR